MCCCAFPVVEENNWSKTIRGVLGAPPGGVTLVPLSSEGDRIHAKSISPYGHEAWGNTGFLLGVARRYWAGLCNTGGEGPLATRKHKSLRLRGLGDTVLLVFYWGVRDGLAFRKTRTIGELRQAFRNAFRYVTRAQIRHRSAFCVTSGVSRSCYAFRKRSPPRIGTRRNRCSHRLCVRGSASEEGGCIPAVARKMLV